MFHRLMILFVVSFAGGVIGDPGTVSAGEPELSGRWRGRWSSESTGHSGPLNAKFRRNGPDSYRVVFTGRFLKVVPFRYAETLHVAGTSESVVYLSGSSRLLGFGTFRFSASATDRAFHADFASRNDRGTFQLSR